jgi:hypothetical protein
MIKFCSPMDDQATLYGFGLTASNLTRMEFKQTNYWVFGTKINITHPKDQQIFFSGPDAKAIKEHLKGFGQGPSTKQTTKGFGPQR